MESIAIIHPAPIRFINSASKPRIIKKYYNKKKSRIGLNLEAISFEKFEADKIIPAKRAPISRENPNT